VCWSVTVDTVSWPSRVISSERVARSKWTCSSAAHRVQG